MYQMIQVEHETMGCVPSDLLGCNGNEDYTNDEYSLLEQDSSAASPSSAMELSLTVAQVTRHSGLSIPEGSMQDCLKSEQIFTAVRERNREKLRALILSSVTDTQTSCIVCVSDKNGVNPVELACLLGYTEEVKLFLENGCSPNLPTSIGRLIHTILECLKSQSIAPMDGHEIVELMCNKGCDLHMKGRRRKSTLLYATELGNPLVLKLILDNYGGHGIDDKDVFCGFTPLHMAALKGDLECLQLLLQYGPVSQVNVCDNRNRTALLLALHNMIHDLRYLNMACEPQLPHSHTINLLNREKLILHQYNAIAVLEALLVAGADPNIGDALSLAFSLVELDETKGLKSLAAAKPTFLTSLSQQCQDVRPIKLQEVQWKQETDKNTEGNNDWVSPYTGVVRLLVYSGARPIESQIFTWKRMFRTNSHILELVNEITEFWRTIETVKPARLMHLCKQSVRIQMAKCHSLHHITHLPLPIAMINYVKLQFL